METEIFPAAPRYVHEQLRNAMQTMPPGHMYSLFYPGWHREDWNHTTQKTKALRKILPMGYGAPLLDQLLRKQDNLAEHIHGDHVLTLGAKSTSPLMTGMGMEHPLENGFAFLNPYGIPYLPGASVKGILRKSAEDLALGLGPDDSNVLSILDLWWLFGFESGSSYLAGPEKKLAHVPEIREKAQILKTHYLERVASIDIQALRPLLTPFIQQACPREEDREKYQERPLQFLEALAEDKDLREGIQQHGLLIFWDVFPKPPRGSLGIDILTPHYSRYYEGKTSPSDTEQPNPVPFLVVPPGSEFTFHVQFYPYAPPEVCAFFGARWKNLVSETFSYAFDWLGFGAKTSVGYGALAQEAPARTFASWAVGKEAEKTEEIPDSLASKEERWENVHLSWKPGDQTLTATCMESNKKAMLKGKDKVEAIVPKELRKKLFGKKKEARAQVVVAAIGNSYTLVRVL